MTKEIQKVEEKNITDTVLNKVFLMQSEGSLDLPANYSAGNALKSAYLLLQETKTKDKQPVLTACTQLSIANALLEMVTLGLNPAKKQCYFIAYGNTLTLSQSYLGTIALTKRLKGVKDVKGYAIYKDDELELDFDIISGKTIVKTYKPSLNRKPADLIGALALIIGEEEILHVEYMDMDQIKAAWNQGQMKGTSGAHKNFPDQMAIKTVINRACKLYANTSDDSGSIVEALNRQSMEATDEEFALEVEENANSQELDPLIVDEETGEVIDPVRAPF